MSKTSFAAFVNAETWETETDATNRKRGAARWSLARALLSNVAWRELEASWEERALLHAYLFALANEEGLPFDMRIEAINLGSAAGLFTNTAIRYLAQELIRRLKSDALSLPDLTSLARWLPTHGLWDDPFVQEAVGIVLCYLDQDDRLRLLRTILLDAPYAKTSAEVGIVGCLIASAEAVARAPDSPEQGARAAEIVVGGEQERTDGEPRNSLTTGRATKALTDLRKQAVPWLAVPHRALDLTHFTRMVTIAFTLWVSPTGPNTVTRERAFTEERRSLSAAFFALAAESPRGRAVLTAMLGSDQDPGANSAALDALWQAGNRASYGYMALRLIRARLSMLQHLFPPTRPAVDSAARLAALLEVADSIVGAAFAPLQALSLQQVRACMAEDPQGAATLLRLLERQAQLETEDVQVDDRRHLLYGVYGRFLREITADEPRSVQGITVDGALAPMLEEWAAERMQETLDAAATREGADAGTIGELRSALDIAQAEMALTGRALNEARALGREGATQGALESRLPVLRHLIALADQIDRSLAAGQGDADSLTWAREQLIDILAAYDVEAVGVPGERTRFDPELHEFVGASGEGQEWHEILESGYVLSGGERTTVLKRVPVRPLVS